MNNDHIIWSYLMTIYGHIWNNLTESHVISYRFTRITVQWRRSTISLTLVMGDGRNLEKNI